MPDFRQAVKLNGIPPLGLVAALATKTAAYTLTATDSVILASATSAAFTVTLPTAAGIAGRTYTVKKTDSSANTVTIATTSSQTIDGLSTLVLTQQWEYVQVISDGSNWQVIDGTVRSVAGAVTLTDAATITVDASQGNHFRVTLAGNRTLGAPSNPANAQKITVEVIQDATGSRTLAYTTTAGGYAFGTDVPSPTLTTTANKRDFLGFAYNATTNLWYCVAVVKGY